MVTFRVGSHAFWVYHIVLDVPQKPPKLAPSLPHYFPLISTPSPPHLIIGASGISLIRHVSR